MKKAVFWALLLLAVILFIPASIQPREGFQTPPSLRSADQLRPPAPSNSSLQSDPDFGRMPLVFIANEGQIGGSVAYHVRGKDKSLYFGPDGLTFVLNQRQKSGPTSSRQGPMARGPKPRKSGELRTWAVKLGFVGANPEAGPVGLDPSETRISYFKGEPAEWKTGLPAYSKIAYPNLWPGIDLVYSGMVDQMKYEFIVAPGADPGQIRLSYQGASEVGIDESGRLEVKTPYGSFQDGVPIAYQEIDGRRVAVSMAYALDQPGVYAPPAEKVKEGPDPVSYHFDIGDYDRSRPLVLDPVVFVYCGFIGGNLDEEVYDIAVDLSGNAYITGYTWSDPPSFPAVVGPDLTRAVNYDAFVAKLNSSGTALLYCGYIGGNGFDWGEGIAVDGSGNAYISGVTDSSQTTFPVLTGPDTSHNGYADAFVAKVNAAGTALVYCGYIGGSLEDWGAHIAVDGSGNAYVAGTTHSTQTTFPETVGPDLTQNGGWDAFVAKVNAAGTALVYCGFIGGSAGENGTGIAVSSAGNAYVTGNTSSTEATFPEVVGPDLTHNGNDDVFVAKINAAGTAFVYCGYIGGMNNDYGEDVAVDASENAYVTGATYSTESDFPVNGGPDLTQNGSWDGFIAKVNVGGGTLAYCGYIGGSDDDGCYGLCIDGSGNVYLAGYAYSDETTFPVLGGLDPTWNGDYDGFVAKVNAGGAALAYCGYVGGSGDEYAYGIALDTAGSVYVSGFTYSAEPEFPVYIGPDVTFNGGYDSFVLKIVEEPLWKPHHAIANLDSDLTEEAVVDLGGAGVWMYDSGDWSQLSAGNPESLLAADVDGDAPFELIADFGFNGLWVWNGGAWYQVSGVNVDCYAAPDTDGEGIDEIVGDFGPAGLWLYNDGTWTQLSGVNADYVAATYLDGVKGDEIVGDFGATGLWIWSSSGGWVQLSGVNADYLAFRTEYGVPAREIVGDFAATGLWVWSAAGGWTQLSGVNADYMIAADADGDGDEEVFGDFAATGLWHWDSGDWTQLSNVNADFMIWADVNGDWHREVIGDFGALGLWLVDGGNWTQISGVNPEYMMAGDLDNDNHDEILADFGTLGLWMWNEGDWSPISAANPE